MPNLDNSAFERQLHDKVKDYESEYSADAWKNMQEKLDETKEPFFGSGFKKTAIIVSAMILLLSLSFLTGYEFRKADVKNSGSTLTKTSLGYQPAVIPNDNQVVKNTPDQKSHTNLPAKGNIMTNRKRGASVAEELMGQSTSDNAAATQQVIKDHNGSIAKPNDIKTNTPVLSQSKENSEIKKSAGESVITKSEDKTVNKSESKLTEKVVSSKRGRYNNVNDPLLFVKRTISFGVYGGENWNMAFDHHLYLTNSSLDGTFGAFINFPLSPRFSIQSGLGYAMVSNKVLIKSDTTVFKNDIIGKVYQVNENSTVQMEYLNLPIVLKYRINHKFRILAGVEVSYAFSAPVHSYSQNYKKDSSKNYRPTNQADSLAPLRNKISNFNSDINRFNLAMQIGFDWNMSKSLDLSLSYFGGLTNILKNSSGYIQTYGNNNYGNIQLRLGFKLFSKEFHED